MADPADPAPSSDPLSNLASLAAFIPSRLLSNDRDAKTAALLGTLAGAPAIVRLAREPFGEGELESGAVTRRVALTPVVRNDCYLRATGVDGAPPAAAAAAAPSLAVEVICPATDKHVAKYSEQKCLTLRESLAAYRAVTLPAVLATPPSRTAWVDNILGGTAEVDRVLARWPPLEEEGAGKGTPPPASLAQAAAAALAASASAQAAGCPAVVLLPDLKWDGADPARLYAVAIFGDPALRSVRDLDTAERVAGVRAAHRACLAALAAATGTRPSALRAFFHYHPSYWRLHIHYAAHGVPASDGVGKAHAVEDVLGDERGGGGAGTEGGGFGGSSAWARKSLVVSLGEGDPLAAPLAAWMDKEGA